MFLWPLWLRLLVAVMGRRVETLSWSLGHRFVIPRLLRSPACSCIVGFLLVAECEYRSIVIFPRLLACALDVERASFSLNLALLVVLISQSLPSLIVFDPLLLMPVMCHRMMCQVHSAEDQGRHFVYACGGETSGSRSVKWRMRIPARESVALTVRRAGSSEYRF